MTARLVLVAVSAAAVVWLSLGLGAVRDEARGVRLAANPERLSGQDERVAEAADALRDAREHNHDTSPLLREAQLHIYAQHPRRAALLLEEIVRREPGNDVAWRSLELATRRTDPARAADARRRARALNPAAG